MLNKADDIGHRGGNPAAGVKMFKEESRDRFLHPQELEAFFHALAAETPLFRDFFAISPADRRPQEQRAGDGVDRRRPSGRLWRIPETKNGTVVVVPLVAPAVAILQARPAADERFPVGLSRPPTRHAPTDAQDGVGTYRQAGRAGRSSPP